MNIETLLQKFSNEFCKLIWQGTQNLGVKGVGYTGSYARGDFSLSRPDINFAIFVEQSTPDLLLELGKVSSSLNEKYSQDVNLRPEYHPDRFVIPWGRDKKKPDLFFKIAVFELEDMNAPFPFGRPGHVIEGHKLSAKIIHGEDYFKKIKITSSNEQLVKGINHILPNWLKQAKLAPLSYNLEFDTDLFFNEAMIWGKLGIQQYAWVQGIKNGFDYSRDEDRQKVFAVIHDKEKLRTFIKIEDTEQGMINQILDSRLNYAKWKNDKSKASGLYLSSCHLLNYFTKDLSK